MNIPLLRQLRDADGAFVPLDALGEPPGSGGVSGDLDELSAFGFAIERHPYRGAAYRGPAARLCPDQIEYGLPTEADRIGRRVAVWNRVTSTNDLAARAAQSTANAGLVVLAEEQSAGRGRRGRAWSSPPRSSVLLSVLVFPAGAMAEPAWLTALGAVAAAEVVSEWTGLRAEIKWPNDVRVGRKKVAGVLVERGAGAVIGIGLNANLAPDDFPADLRATSASLRTLVGVPVDRSELARALILRLDARYEEARREGAGRLAVPWRDRSEHLGRPVLVSTPSGPFLGRLDHLDLWDGLRLTSADGTPVVIPARHILSIDPADAPAITP